MTVSTLSKNRIQQNKKLNVKSPIQQRKRVPCVQINRCRSWWNQLRNLNVHLIINQSPHTVCTKWCIQRYKISLQSLFKKSSNFFCWSYKKPILHKKNKGQTVPPMWPKRDWSAVDRMWWNWSSPIQTANNQEFIYSRSDWPSSMVTVNKVSDVSYT